MVLCGRFSLESTLDEGYPATDETGRGFGDFCRFESEGHPAQLDLHGGTRDLRPGCGLLRLTTLEGECHRSEP